MQVSGTCDLSLETGFFSDRTCRPACALAFLMDIQFSDMLAATGR